MSKSVYHTTDANEQGISVSFGEELSSFPRQKVCVDMLVRTHELMTALVESLA